MTTNKYATLRGTIARAKRNDCQKVVMRVTLAEELLAVVKSRGAIAELKQYWHVIGAGQLADGYYCHLSDAPRSPQCKKQN
jgi:hypothetical protein